MGTGNGKGLRGGESDVSRFNQPGEILPRKQNDDWVAANDSFKGCHTSETGILDTIESDSSLAMAIQMLFRAACFARDCQRPPWDFAVEIQDLQSGGVTSDEIRWLVGKGLISHQLDISPPDDLDRSFEVGGLLTFKDNSCFVLSEQGRHLASLLRHIQQVSGPQVDQQAHQREGPNQCPYWDSQRHELTFQGELIKRYKGKAENQQAILNAFEEENWPPRIDDPLPPQPDTNSKRRLSDTIKCLNRKQSNQLIRFSGDGTGEGVLWTIVPRDTQRDLQRDTQRDTQRDLQRD